MNMTKVEELMNMTNLSKVVELTPMIGKETSDNYSPTLRSKLVEVTSNGCVFEIAPNHYTEEGNEMVGTRKIVPLWLSANMFFGI